MDQIAGFIAQEATMVSRRHAADAWLVDRMPGVFVELFNPKTESRLIIAVVSKNGAKPAFAVYLHGGKAIFAEVRSFVLSSRGMSSPAKTLFNQQQTHSA